MVIENQEFRCFNAQTEPSSWNSQNWLGSFGVLTGARQAMSCENGGVSICLCWNIFGDDATKKEPNRVTWWDVSGPTTWSLEFQIVPYGWPFPVGLSNPFPLISFNKRKPWVKCIGSMDLFLLPPTWRNITLRELYLMLRMEEILYHLGWLKP